LDEVSLPDQHENNIRNIKSLAFYHEIRWNLGKRSRAGHRSASAASGDELESDRP